MVTEKTSRVDGKLRETLVFSEGVLSIHMTGYGQLNGSGVISFCDDVLDYADQGEDTVRFCKLPRSELIAIRDFLIRVLAATAEDAIPSRCE